MNTVGDLVRQHFAGKSFVVRVIYRELKRAVGKFGAWTEDPKKTSIHFNRRTAFAGVATRKDAVILTIKTNRDIQSPRIVKTERTSANRWHLAVRLSAPADVDSELVSWLRDAYELSE